MVFDYFYVMAITKLNIKYIPHFIYLMDDLISTCNNIVDTKEIAYHLEEKGYKISEKSLGRTLVLREQLNKKSHLSAKVHIPMKITLDAITKYLYGVDFMFRDLVTQTIGISNEEIEKHYFKHRPTQAILDAIFSPKPEKIRFIESQIDFCKKSKASIQDMSMEEFIEEINRKVENFKKETKNELLLKDLIIENLEKRIGTLEKKLKQASFVYRFFGFSGLFFVPIDYRELTMDILFDDYIEGWDNVSSFPDIIDNA